MTDKQMKKLLDELSVIVNHVCTSPACYDTNFEKANLVDGFYSIGRALDHVAVAIEKVADGMKD